MHECINSFFVLFFLGVCFFSGGIYDGFRHGFHSTQTFCCCSVLEPSTAGLKGASFQMLQADWFLLGCISSLPETYAFSSMLLDKHLELNI